VKVTTLVAPRDRDAHWYCGSRASRRRLIACPDHRVTRRDGALTDEEFDTLYRSLYPKLYRVAYAILFSRQAAEDAVQIGATKFYRSYVKRWNTIVNPAGALYRSVWSACQNEMGSEGRQRDKVREWGIIAPKENSRVESASVTRVDVQRCLELLPLDPRRAVVLVDAFEMSHADAAELLETPDGTLRRWLATARKQLRQCLGSAVETDD
jgi:RNA polymerase sigma factor (sigma-70 family)